MNLSSLHGGALEITLTGLLRVLCGKQVRGQGTDREENLFLVLSSLFTFRRFYAFSLL